MGVDRLETKGRDPRAELQDLQDQERGEPNGAAAPQAAGHPGAEAKDAGYIVYPKIAPKDNVTEYRMDFTLVFASVVKAAKIKSKRVSPQVLRHTFAC